MRSRWLASLFLGILVGVAGCGGGAASPAGSGGGAAGAVSFAGKTVTLINNFTAGGPSDLEDRLDARYLASFLPGKPTVIVDDVPGAGGEIGWNRVYTAKPDGLTLCVCSDPITAALIGDPGVKWDNAKFVWIGSVPYTVILFAATSAARTPEDLLHPAQPLVFAGLGQSAGLDIVSRLFLDLAGVKYRYVTGYPGLAQVKQALLSHEVNLSSDALGSWFSMGYPALQQSGEMVPLTQSGILDAEGRIVADPRSNLPIFPDVIRQLTGKDPSGDAWDALQMQTGYTAVLRGLALPPGTPASIAQTLDKGFQDMFHDAAFAADWQKLTSTKAQLTDAKTTGSILAHLESQRQSHPRAIALLQRMAAVKPN